MCGFVCGRKRSPGCFGVADENLDGDDGVESGEPIIELVGEGNMRILWRFSALASACCKGTTIDWRYIGYTAKTDNPMPKRAMFAAGVFGRFCKIFDAT